MSPPLQKLHFFIKSSQSWIDLHPISHGEKYEWPYGSDNSSKRSEELVFSNLDQNKSCAALDSSIGDATGMDCSGNYNSICENKLSVQDNKGTLSS